MEAAWPPRLRFDFYERTMFAVDIGFVLLTVLAVAIKVARRTDWEVRDWVAVATGAFLALYLAKAVAAFDDGHVGQVFFASLPLALLWSWRLFEWLGRLLAAWWRGWGARPAWLAQPVAAVLVPVIALGLVYGGALRKVDGQHHLAGITESSLARVGYEAPGMVDAGLLRDLDTAIRAYAGDDGPVVDMTLSSGYLYYLLGRVPGTRFINVALASNAGGQRLLIDELKTARPPVVIYDATTIGASAWGGAFDDNIANNVRHYDVSEYLLRGWTPVLRTHGVLVMARNDLVASRPIPALSTPPQTTDLYFNGYLIGPSCRWGATPNYLPVPESSRATAMPVRPMPPRTEVRYSGWAFDPATNLPASTVLIADGDRVVGIVKPTIARSDVARHLHQPQSTPLYGFKYNAMIDAAPTHLAVYSLGADGLARPLVGLGLPTGSEAVLRLPEGSQVRVTPTIGGYVDQYQTDVYTVGELQLPSGIDLRDYDLATLSSRGGLGGATVALTDQFQHEIEGRWLDQAGPSLTLRVGSCPQWYGYDPSKPLYVVQSGGPPVTSVTLSSAMRS